MLHLRARPPELESVCSLNDHMLTDIGLETDTFRPDMRRQQWPD
jgi:hypothetical protein